MFFKVFCFLIVLQFNPFNGNVITKTNVKTPTEGIGNDRGQATVDTNVQFCTSFKDNNYTIDYSFDYMGDDTNDRIHFFVIGHKVWRVIAQISTEYKLTIEPKVYAISDWFGNQYSTAFTIWSQTLNRYITGMVRKDRHPLEIEWGIFEGSTLKNANRSLDTSWMVVKRSLTKEARPFQSMVSQYYHRNEVYFMERTKSRTLVPNKWIHLILQGNYLTLKRDDMESYLTFDKEVEIIAFLNSNVLSYKGKFLYAFLVYVVDQSVKYFAQLPGVKRVELNTNDSETLIDCKEEVGVSTDHFDPWIWVFILLVIITIILIIAIVWTYRRRSKRRKYRFKLDPSTPSYGEVVSEATLTSVEKEKLAKIPKD